MLYLDSSLLATFYTLSFVDIILILLLLYYHYYSLLLFIIILENNKKVREKVGRLWGAREALPLSNAIESKI